MSDDKPVEAVVRYGIWDADYKDLVLLPGPDGYLHSSLESLDALKFCIGTNDDSLVKVTIEHIKP